MTRLPRDLHAARRGGPAGPARALLAAAVAAALVAALGCTARPKVPPAPLTGPAASPLVIIPPHQPPTNTTPSRPGGPATPAPTSRLEPAGAAGAPQAELVRRVVAQGDHGGRSFVVIDKPSARLSVFDATGRLLDSAPVLLGLATGDRSVPGIGERPLADIRREERTTPAGRFVAEPGRNLSGEDIVWVDYDAAVSLHRVRPLDPSERRLQRLASPTPADNRISYGCVNVPVAFYERWVKPAFATPGGVVYVLPEREPMARVFPALFGPDRHGPALAAVSTGG
jgi:hypothetical protein